MSPLLRPLSYRAGSAATLAPGAAAVAHASTARRRLRYAAGPMLLGASEALSQTLALLATFGGIGILVGVLVFYIIGQVLAVRRQNQERREGGF